MEMRFSFSNESSTIISYVSKVLSLQRKSASFAHFQAVHVAIRALLRKTEG